MSFRKRVVGTDLKEEVLIELEGNDEGGALFVSREVAAEKTIQDHFSFGSKVGLCLNRKELEYLVATGAKMIGWQAGQDLNLNPSNLPTRAKLADAVRDAMNAHPIAKEDRSFARFLQALEVMRTYLSWLPEEHREGGDRDLKYIERRLEELLMFRRFVKTFVEMFRSRPGAAMAATEMFSNVMSFVRMLKETTGVDLEGSDDT